MASNGSRKMFVNLPVTDLDKSIEFFTKLGFTFYARFTDETATAMIPVSPGAHRGVLQPTAKGHPSERMNETKKPATVENAK